MSETPQERIERLWAECGAKHDEIIELKEELSRFHYYTSMQRANLLTAVIFHSGWLAWFGVIALLVADFFK